MASVTLQTARGLAPSWWAMASGAAVLILVALVTQASQSLGTAEHGAALVAQQGAATLWSGGESPAYALVLDLWVRAFGTSELGLRSLSLVWAVGLMVATGAMARRLVPYRGTALTSLLVAGSPLVVYCTGEASPYVQASSLAALATWRYWASAEGGRSEVSQVTPNARQGREPRGELVVELPLRLQAQPGGREPMVSVAALQGLSGWVGYGLLAMAAVATHPLAMVVVVAHGCHGALAPAAGSKRLTARTFSAALVVGLLLSSWLAVVLSHRLTAAMAEAGVTEVASAAPPGWAIPWWAVAPIALLGAARFAEGGRLRVVALLLGPAVALGLYGVLFGGLEGRAHLLAVPGVAVGLGAGVARLAELTVQLGGLGHRAVPRPRAVGLEPVLALMAVGAMAWAGWATLGAPSFARSDYRGLIGRVLAEGKQGDVVLLAGTGEQTLVEYYNRGQAPVVELPSEANLPSESGEALLESLGRGFQRVWLVAESPSAELEGWLADRLYPVTSYSHGPLTLGLYVTEPEMRSGLGRTTFGTIVELPEARLPALPVGRDLAVPVRLHWRAKEPLASRLVVIVHLVDDAGRIVGQRESEPVGGFRPATSWAADKVVVDRIGVPLPDIPTGSYRVRVGLYDAMSRARLPLADGREALEIGAVRVGPAVRPPLIGANSLGACRAAEENIVCAERSGSAG